MHCIDNYILATVIDSTAVSLPFGLSSTSLSSSSTSKLENNLELWSRIRSGYIYTHTITSEMARYLDTNYSLLLHPNYHFHTGCFYRISIVFRCRMNHCISILLGHKLYISLNPEWNWNCNHKNIFNYALCNFLSSFVPVL